LDLLRAEKWPSLAARILVLCYPLIYLIYTLVRGSFTGTYPYPFLDVGVIGYGGMMANVAVLLIVFLGMGLAIVAISRKLGQANPG